METRSEVHRHALLFNSNTMYDLLVALGKVEGQFHAAALSRGIGHSRAQTKSELAKLRALGIVASDGFAGRREQLYLANDPLVDAVLDLPGLLTARLATLER